MTAVGMSCDVCGEPLLEGAYFCGECGARVPVFADPAQQPTPQETPQNLTPQAPAPAPPTEPQQQVVAPPVVPPPAPAPAPTPAPAPVEPTPSPTPGLTLVFASGERARVTGYGRLGRVPTATGDAAPDHLIVVADDTRTVSKNHLDVWVTDGGLELLDLGSANGTVVSMPGIAAERLIPGSRLVVGPGTRIDIGDQSFTIE